MTGLRSSCGVARAGSSPPGAQIGWSRRGGAKWVGLLPATGELRVDAAAVSGPLGATAVGGQHGPGDGASGAKRIRLQPLKVCSWCLRTEPDSDSVCHMEEVLDTHQLPLDLQHPVVCVEEVSQVPHQ